MGNHNPQLQIALENVFDCVSIDWSTYKNDYYYLQEHIINACSNFNADYVFMHTQDGNVVHIPTLQYLTNNGIKVINWTGGVRHPIPNHYLETGRNIFLTLFTNMNDVDTMCKMGIRTDFLQVGFDERYFNPVGAINGQYPPILFLGSNYCHTAMFPLSVYRKTMVETLQREFGAFFGVFGTGWHNANGCIYDFMEEGTAYRSCKIAINLSHFSYSRYSSDRLYRIMGSGAFCLSHKYPDIEADFELGKELVAWEDIDELIEKIKYYLNNDAERRNIALKGCELVRSKFTWHNFAHNLNELIHKHNQA